MALLEVRVDGEVKFSGEVDDVVLPSRPEMYPQALRATPGAPPTPLARITMLTALIDLMRRAFESPLLAPCEVEVLTHGMGKATIAIALELGD